MKEFPAIRRLSRSVLTTLMAIGLIGLRPLPAGADPYAPILDSIAAFLRQESNSLDAVSARADLEAIHVESGWQGTCVG